MNVLDNSLSITVSIVVFGWMGLTTQKSYNEMKERNVQPWLKKKTLIVAISAYIESMVSLPDL
ncbi:MAG: hypothetical protein GY870_00840 [archaeon]|nr:hypothetical protein [archaeon]